MFLSFTRVKCRWRLKPFFSSATFSTPTIPLMLICLRFSWSVRGFAMVGGQVCAKGDCSCPGWKWSWRGTWWQFFMQQSPPFAAFHWWVQGEGVSPAGPCWAAGSRCTERLQILRIQSFVQFRSMLYSYFTLSSFKSMKWEETMLL